MLGKSPTIVQAAAGDGFRGLSEKAMDEAWGVVGAACWDRWMVEKGK